ncbi:MAG: hypothetical protein WC886_08195, partial [Saccharofermentanaceae bacterium]
FFVVMVLFSNSFLLSQVAVNADGTSPDSSAMLDVKSTTKGMLIPRMIISERDNINNPATGLLVFCTDDNRYYSNTGTPSLPEWIAVNSQWTTIDSNITYGTGRVGIGTNTPEAKLEVAGDAKISGILVASPRIYLVENNIQETISSTEWADYMTKNITVGKDSSNILFIFNFSHPYEFNSPSIFWRVGINETFSNPKFMTFPQGNRNILPGGFSFLIQGVDAGTYLARLQYKFNSGGITFSPDYPEESFNSLIIIVL